MVINEELLFSSGGELMHYDTDEAIFNEGDSPRFYFQIITGTVKINNYHEDGREIIHSVPFDGHCFAETSIFSNKDYPINAVAMTDCEIVRLEKNKFLNMINSSPELLMKLYTFTAERMHYRYIMLNNMSAADPRTKIIGLIDCFKTYNNFREPYSYQFPFTRQQLAAFTGLSVETVIRTVKKMEKEKIVKIETGKILY
ncbi:Crp/Fnr family transcriptional regulator [Chryseobacterium soli]|uniref:Crp/Fnr family transcriptional regulator n=1 Tax=Chryseobacterium soli TaxID=445961 RepID=UPI00068CE188|nr:Crp/Fnr family transcriptional regulator [Chryseobacterium soli]MDV7695973.1 Crp/Fnr family transcriptional regulator [Chryseobacterium soli]